MNKELLDSISKMIPEGNKLKLPTDERFATPLELADRMVKMAGIRNGDEVLEPSAGQGAILDAIYRVYGVGNYVVDAVEVMDQNVKVLGRTFSGKCRQIFHMDFLKSTPTRGFNRIIANPPFSKNQDIDHIYHMYSHLAIGGRIVTLSSMSWTFGSRKKQVAFREWLDAVGASVEEVPKGTFKSSGTNVSAMLIVINK